MRRAFSISVLAILAVAAMLAHAPPAAAHRLDLAAATSIWKQSGGDGCGERLSDHRVRCRTYHEEWPDVGEPYDWDEYDDLVLVGSKLYDCSAGTLPSTEPLRRCDPRGGPLELTVFFRGRSASGRKEIAVDMAARGRGGYFIPFAFSTAGYRFDGLQLPCMFGDGHVEKRSSGISGHVRSGRIHAREEFGGEDRDEGGNVVRASTGVGGLTGFVTRRRMTVVARLSEHFNNGTACTGMERLSLNATWNAPRYIDW